MQTIATNSFETIHLRPIHLRPIHLRPFIWDHIHLRPHPFETTSIWDHIHLRPHPFETTSIWDHIHLRPHPFEITFILRYVKVKLFWLTVNHSFVYFPLPCGRPDVLQGDSSLKDLQGYTLLCPRWLMLGCGQEDKTYNSLAWSKWHFRGATLPSKPEVCRVFWLLRCFKVWVASAFTTQHESPLDTQGCNLAKLQIIMMIYCGHMVHIVGAVNDAWARKMVSHNLLYVWHIKLQTSGSSHSGVKATWAHHII